MRKLRHSEGNPNLDSSFHRYFCHHKKRQEIVGHFETGGKSLPPPPEERGVETVGGVCGIRTYFMVLRAL